MSTETPEKKVLSALKWSLWRANTVDEFFDLFKSLTSKFLKCRSVDIKFNASESERPHIIVTCTGASFVETYKVDLEYISIVDKKITASVKSVRYIERK
jgi:hypothetical protein